MIRNHAARLDESVAAVCPILGVSVGTPGVSETVRINFAPASTGQQQTNAQGVVNAFDWSDSAHDAWVVNKEKVSAKDAMDGNISLGFDNRAIARLIVDEINSLRQWIVAFKVQVAAATTLADLKTRVATLPNMPDRTLSQAKAAYKALIDGGTLDE